jgi:hypothetical protein
MTREEDMVAILPFPAKSTEAIRGAVSLYKLLPRRKSSSDQLPEEDLDLGALADYVCLLLFLPMCSC